MTYQEFIDAVLVGIKEYMGNKVEITIKKILKNNSVYLDGLTIMEENQNISPTIYLNPYYNDYLNGKSIGDIVFMILEIYENKRLSHKINVDFYTNFQNVSEKIVYKLINYEKNRDLLENIPHIRYLDLAIVFYCLVQHDTLGSASILIYNSHMKIWGISKSDLLKIAKKNTPQLLKYDLRSLNDVMLDIVKDNMLRSESDIVDEHADEISLEEKEQIANEMLTSINNEGVLPMYVLSNREKTNGAACILYHNILRDFANRMNQDLYILPSSIHEVIIIPAAFGNSPERLEEMVREVNRTQLEAEEILSDRVYYYSREKACIC